MKAVVKYIYDDGAEEIEVNGHRIQFGCGSGGDGYCYAHQTFDCREALTVPELMAVCDAKYDVEAAP